MIYIADKGRSCPTPSCPTKEKKMAHVTYHIVEHDGGWAYKLGDVFSETFRTRDAAIQAARNAAMEQQIPGQTSGIRYEDGSGKWHEEIAEGDDRPEADVSTTD
jgi:hypothetical protein